MTDNIAVRTLCGRRDMAIAAMGQDNGLLVIACLYFLVGIMVTILVLALLTVTGARSDKRDSQGVPCTISTAQNADGSPECK